jgi:hypothetical protein
MMMSLSFWYSPVAAFSIWAREKGQLRRVLECFHHAANGMLLRGVLKRRNCLMNYWWISCKAAALLCFRAHPEHTTKPPHSGLVGLPVASFGRRSRSKFLSKKEKQITAICKSSIRTIRAWYRPRKQVTPQAAQSALMMPTEAVMKTNIPTPPKR